jgi:hypothetical protein
LSKGESIGPSSETGKEVDLGVFVNVERMDFLNVTGVYVSWRN